MSTRILTRLRSVPRIPGLCRSFRVAAPAQNTGGVKQLGVIGAGQMGLGIAFVAALMSKVPVVLYDPSEASISKSLGFLEKLLQKDVAKGKYTQAVADQVVKLIEPTMKFDSIFASDFIIEAVPEIVSLKCEIFGKLAAGAKRDTILSTNTSSISITKIAAAAKGAEDRVVSTHFMNPVPVQKGVEIISGLQTSRETVGRAIEFVKSMGKLPSVSTDNPGFIANRILIPYINEAIICLETGVGQKEDIDNIMKNGCAMPMGPLALADFIGLDTCLAIMNVLYTQTGDTKYRPAVLLQKMVDAGWLGVKSKKGFYDY
ncbi:3-hydroxyacyl-CoA dehydrogenase [Lipomyces tetrasporus]|uniref:3-hydroxyacyl-CoA dehydrogenase n=1 Tax=Lipomyces tetrasporus TaxID=54092 RepID=A0AAD7QMZ6_9ASCO|nr:3-hydroxyacyl-CoA dehydrogenase [Lipomyces tetrasporus]KAJ8098330.1 3-hydroxyacyl-CoA dehydrogenase [Lipomyces tetrasporus]